MFLKYLLLCLTMILFAASEEERSCECSNANLMCLLQNLQPSTGGKCPPCPNTTCTIPANQCDREKRCDMNEKCRVNSDSSNICIPDPVENAVCSFTRNCFDSRVCDDGILPGTVREQECAPGLFCRQTARVGCHVTGTCISASNSMLNEARCLRDMTADPTRCFADGDYKCSITETRPDGDQVQTCYDTTNGQVLETFTPTSASRVSEEKCRPQNEASCKTSNGRLVLSGDRFADPLSRCSYCTCQDGTIDRSSCTTKVGCVPSPASCTDNGRTVPDGKVLNKNSCVQSRCENGDFVETRDADCDGADDTDPCSGASEAERDVVCTTTSSGLKQRTQKCRAMALGASSTNGRCGDDEVCSCEAAEICVEDTDSKDLCIEVDSNGCKKKKCITVTSDTKCTTDETNQPICSSTGITYESECKAYVSLDHNIKCLRACDDPICTDTNDGNGFCGYDGITYANLGELEKKTGYAKADYRGACEVNNPEPTGRCEAIENGCTFTTRTSDAVCPISGGQAVLNIDVNEAQEFAFSRGKSELTGMDLCKEALSDWETLTAFQVSDSSCEVSCRPKYDTLGALILQVRAKQGTDCTTCGDRTKVFVNNLRQDKAKGSSGVNRRRRQTNDSEPSGSGLFISPSGAANDPTYHAGAISLLASSLLVFISLMLAFIFTSN